MSNPFECLSAYTLEPFQFIGGTLQELTFDVYDSASAPLDLSNTTCYWVMSPYGNPQYATLTINGVQSGTVTNQFRVTISGSSTQNLQGKFTHQPVILDYNGKEYRPSQGVLIILARNASA